MLSSAVAVSEARHSDLLFPIGLLGEEQTTLKLTVDQSTELDIISPQGLAYNIGEGTVLFDVFGPLFCFGLAGNDQASGLALQLRNSNGDPIIDGLTLASNLNYRLTTSEIAMSTPPSGACFYETAEGFGLSGMVPTEEPTGLFRDRFEEFSSLSVRFENVPQVARVDEPVSYTIVLENTGLRDLTQVAVQELYPRNNELYDVVLRQGSYSCVEVASDEREPDCADGRPVQIPELGFVDRPWIRGENLDLPRGTSVRFEINERPVATRVGLDEGDVINSRIDLYAGAVVVDGVESVPPSSSATATIRIAGPAESLIIDDQASILDATANGVDEVRIVVQARDDFGGVPNVTIESEIVGGNAADIQITPSAVTDSVNGSAQFIATTTRAGDYDVQFSATIDGQPITTVPETLEFSAGPATALRFVAQPVDAVVGQPLKPVSVELLDAFDNRVLSDSKTSIELALGGGDGTGELAGGDATTAFSGLATFGGLTIDQAAADYVLTASAATTGRGGITPDSSSPFTIEQASPSVRITDVDPAGEQQVNEPYTVSAEVQGGFGPTGLIEVDNGDSVCTITAPAGSCELSSPSTQLGDITLTATYLGDDNNTDASDNLSYTIIPGDPHQLVFSTQPVDATAGQNFQTVVVSVLDEFDNLVDWDNGTRIDLTLGDDDGESVPLEGSTTLTVAGGVAGFTDLSTAEAGADYRLTAAATGLIDATSNPFDVTPAGAFALEFLSIPSDLVSGLPLDPALQVGVVDDFGNIVSNDTRSIILRIGDGINLRFIASQGAVGGIASFGQNVPTEWYGRDLQFETLSTPSLAAPVPAAIDVSAAAFAFDGFDAISADQTAQASVEVDASASDLPGSTLIRYRLTLLDGNGSGVEGFVFTYCADGPACTVDETLPPTDAEGQAFFGPEDGITASDAGIIAPGGASSLFEFELSPAGDYSLEVELLEVDPEDSSQLEWLGQGGIDAFTVSNGD
jgi:uncharacterized repeat protein (TIGR01451 family)